MAAVRVAALVASGGGGGDKITDKITGGGNKITLYGEEGGGGEGEALVERNDYDVFSMTDVEPLPDFKVIVVCDQG